MSQTLTIELSDAVYTIIQRQAEAARTSLAHWLSYARSYDSRQHFFRI